MATRMKKRNGMSSTIKRPQVEQRTMLKVATLTRVVKGLFTFFAFYYIL